ncbi:MAG: hypothetical protein Q8J91_06335, partial [Pseudomonas sp.]|nr:hypothetical protein [Pseudomonas sp.]
MSTAWKSSAPGVLPKATGFPATDHCKLAPTRETNPLTVFLHIPSLSVRPSNATLADMKNVSPTYLKHQFLIAMPHMADPNFAHT